MPSREHVRRARDAMRRSADWNFFFEKLTSPGWIAPLEEEDAFLDPPPAQSDGKSVSFPFWAPAEYLVRMAPLAPDLVMDTILRVPSTDNIRIHQSFVDAALVMPAAVAARIVPPAKEWLGAPYQMLLPDKVGRLVAHLAEGGQSQAALDLAAALLAVKPDPRYAGAPEATWLGRPRGGFEDFFFKEILKRDIPVLLKADPGGSLEMLADALQAAIDVSVRPQENRPREDISYAWQPAVEDHAQNHDYDLRSLLVRAVRNAAMVAVTAGVVDLAEVVRRFGERPWKIFTRIALYLVEEGATRDPELAKRLTFDTTLLGDIGVDHEYWNLAAAVFPSLSEEEQQQFLGMLKEELEREERRAEEAGSPEAVAKGKRLARHSWLRQLTRLKEHLPESARADLAQLESEFPTLEHPEFLSYMTTWTGPTSPKLAADLAAMSIEEQVEFLRTWQPLGNMMDHSPEGLGRTLTTAVEGDPQKYASHAATFTGLDPTYIRAFFNGLRAARKTRRSFEWPSVLDLADWVMAQERSIRGREPDAEERDKDPDWGWTRKEIAGLLEDGFQHGEGMLPYGYAPRAWTLLAALAKDPDPTPEHETQYGGNNMDPLTLSLNCVRTVALHAVVQYALWRFRELEVRGDTEALKRGFANMPEVRDLLEEHLLVARDPSLAVRGVFGRWLPWLYLIDPTWTRAHLPQLLPRGNEQRALRNAAWSSYLLYTGGVYNQMLELLSDEYAFAIDRIGKEHFGGGNEKEVEPQLADHLMVFYLRGLLPLEDELGLLQRFYRTAPEGTRGHALGFIGRTLTNDNSPALPAELRARLERLLDWRIASETPWSERADELAEFGWWFGSGKLDPQWALPRLLNILRFGRKIEADHLVVKQLEVLSETDPAGAAEALKWVVEVDDKGWGFSLWAEQGGTILQRAFASGNEDACTAALRVRDLLAARGNRTYAGHGPPSA
jgi:hypothetical protein